VLTILVLDDDDLIRHALARAFGRDGHRVTPAATRAEAMAAAASVDLAVMDIHAGPENGIEITRELLASGRIRSGIFFTSDRDPLTLAAVNALGQVVHDVDSLRALVRGHSP
jgi:two-component system, OmpR family, response regulator MprA